MWFESRRSHKNSQQIVWELLVVGVFSSSSSPRYTSSQEVFDYTRYTLTHVCLIALSSTYYVAGDIPSSTGTEQILPLSAVFAVARFADPLEPVSMCGIHKNMCGGHLLFPQCWKETL